MKSEYYVCTVTVCPPLLTGHTTDSVSLQRVTNVRSAVRGRAPRVQPAACC